MIANKFERAYLSDDTTRRLVISEMSRSERVPIWPLRCAGLGRVCWWYNASSGFV